MSLAKQIDEMMRNTLLEDGAWDGEGEPPEGCKVVQGIVRSFAFNVERLEAHKEEIREILTRFDDVFMAHGGEGSSFLGLCYTKDGEHWGEHTSMEALCCLAIGVNLAQWSLPRNMWDLLPGSMPYVTFFP